MSNVVRVSTFDLVALLKRTNLSASSCLSIQTLGFGPRLSSIGWKICSHSKLERIRTYLIPDANLTTWLLRRTVEELKAEDEAHDFFFGRLGKVKKIEKKVYKSVVRYRSYHTTRLSRFWLVQFAETLLYFLTPKNASNSIPIADEDEVNILQTPKVVKVMVCQACQRPQIMSTSSLRSTFSSLQSQPPHFRFWISPRYLRPSILSNSGYVGGHRDIHRHVGLLHRALSRPSEIGSWTHIFSCGQIGQRR